MSSKAFVNIYDSFQHDSSRLFGNVISYNERFLSFINQSHDSITLEGINHLSVESIS